MTIIEASSVRVQTMADSTLRLVVDIEPRFANEAFQLFGKAGTPMALAGLKTPQERAKAEAATQTPAEPEKPKGGLLSQWAAMRCGEPRFQLWLSEAYPKPWALCVAREKQGDEVAAEVIRRVCCIQSRAELDHDDAARERFDRLIRGPWSKQYAAQTA